MHCCRSRLRRSAKWWRAKPCCRLTRVRWNWNQQFHEISFELIKELRKNAKLCSWSHLSCPGTLGLRLSAVAGIMERDNEHHNNDDLPEHAHRLLGPTQAARHGVATACAFTARARSFERCNIARHRHHQVRCAS